MKRGHSPAVKSTADITKITHESMGTQALADWMSGSPFGAVFESSGEALLITDSSGLIHLTNSRARELLRIRGDSKVPLKLGDCLSKIPFGSVDELVEHRREKIGFDATLTDGWPIRITLRSLLPPSGELLLCIQDGSVVPSAEVKWRQTEAELLSILESVRSGVILFDLSGQIRQYNARFGQFFGLDARALEQIKNFSQLNALTSGRFGNTQAFLAPWQSFISGHGEPGHDELEILYPCRRVLERFFRPVLNDRHLPMGWLELYSDVTGERQVESKILQSEKTAALGLLVSGIAHELNNPLTAIMGYAQLLLGHGLLPAQLAEASMVYEEAERARRIVKNLLYFARENSPERIPVDINDLISRTVALRSYELKMKNIAVQCELAAGLPKTMADPHQLQQVILNLLVNSEHALLESRGPGTIRIRSTLNSRNGEDWISVEVADDGPGIAKEISSRIFDPFFTTKAAGMGTARSTPEVIVLDHQMLDEVPLVESVHQFAAMAPVILLAPLQNQSLFATLTAAGNLDFVAREGDFIPLAAGLVERRIRWAQRPPSSLERATGFLPDEVGEIFRHEINNPLTGILGNAELLLSHRDGLSSADKQRLQVVVDLAVRLRETIRRLGNSWDPHPRPLKPF